MKGISQWFTHFWKGQLRMIIKLSSCELRNLRNISFWNRKIPFPFEIIKLDDNNGQIMLMPFDRSLGFSICEDGISIIAQQILTNFF